MSSKNYKLPSLPKAPSAPKSTLKLASPGSSGVSNVAGLNTGKTTAFNFGRPSQGRSRSSKTGSQWSSLISNAASGGAGGALSSVAGFGSGIASIIGGLTSLFGGGGGKSTPPPLVDFSLPTSQQQLVTIGGGQSVSGNYTGPQSAAPTENHSAQIIQTVKQALLNSSSLNDVIAEL